MEHIAWAKEIEEIQNLKISFVIENHNLLKEIESVVGAQDDVVTLLYSRRALEVIITELCVEKLCRERGSEPLNSLIDKLYKEKNLPEYIQTSMQNLNRISTFGAHPKEFDPRQVRTTLIELVTVLEWFFKERNYKAVEKKATITEKQIKAEPIASETIIKENTQQEIKVNKPKKFPVKAVSIVAGLVAIVILLLIVFTQKNTESNLPTKSDTLAAGKQIEKDTTTKSTSRDTQSLTIAATNVVQPEKQPSKTLGLKTKQEKPIIQENKKTYTMQAPQPGKEEDIYSLFKQLSDTKKEWSERKVVSQKLLQMFDKQAIVTIRIDNQIVERKAIKEYLDKILTLGKLDIKILDQPRNSTGKIKSLDVVEIRK